MLEPEAASLSRQSCSVCDGTCQAYLRGGYQPQPTRWSHSKQICCAALVPKVCSLQGCKMTLSPSFWQKDKKTSPGRKSPFPHSCPPFVGGGQKAGHRRKHRQCWVSSDFLGWSTGSLPQLFLSSSLLPGCGDQGTGAGLESLHCSVLLSHWPSTALAKLLAGLPATLQRIHPLVGNKNVSC